MCVCVRVCERWLEAAAREAAEEEAVKNKNLTQRCGEKHTILGALLEVDTSKKCTPLWCEAHVEVKMLKTQHVWTTFVRSDVFSRGKRKGLCTLSKMSRT